MSVVPVYDICMTEPLVMLSRRRRKDISCGARPGLVGEEERICEMWTGRPVKVERTSRCVRDLCVVNRRNSGAGAAILCCGVKVFKEVLRNRYGRNHLFCQSKSDAIA